MRLLTVFLALGILAAFVMPASALTIPSYLPGVDYLKSRNEDNGAEYFITDPGLFAASGGYGHTYTQAEIASPTSGITKVTSAGAMPGEDSWAIFRLWHIESGAVDPTDTQVNPTGTVTYSDDLGTGGTQLIGIVYGGHDVGVTFFGPTTEQIQTTNLHFELWAVSSSALAASATAAGVGPLDGVSLVSFNAANRLSNDQYAGWLDPTSKAGAQLLLDGVSTEDFFLGTVNTHGVTGNTNAYFDVNAAGTGLWDAAWGSNPALVSFVNSVSSDIWFNWTDTNSQRGWGVQSQDNGGVADTVVIPEPLTMLGLFLSVGGVGGYLRRRSRLA